MKSSLYSDFKESKEKNKEKIKKKKTGKAKESLDKKILKQLKQLGISLPIEKGGC